MNGNENTVPFDCVALVLLTGIAYTKAGGIFPAKFGLISAAWPLRTDRNDGLPFTISSQWGFSWGPPIRDNHKYIYLTHSITTCVTHLRFCISSRIFPTTRIVKPLPVLHHLQHIPKLYIAIIEVIVWPGFATSSILSRFTLWPVRMRNQLFSVQRSV